MIITVEHLLCSTHRGFLPIFSVPPWWWDCCPLDGFHDAGAKAVTDGHKAKKGQSRPSTALCDSITRLLASSPPGPLGGPTHKTGLQQSNQNCAGYSYSALTVENRRVLSPQMPCSPLCHLHHCLQNPRGLSPKFGEVTLSPEETSHCLL